MVLNVACLCMLLRIDFNYACSHVRVQLILDMEVRTFAEEEEEEEEEDP